jgi:predicted nucleic acid-binding protein
VSPRCFVINDWIIHDLRGENRGQAQQEAVNFISTLKSSCDKFAVVGGNQWMLKAYELMKHAGLPLIKISKELHSLIRDPKKCLILDHSEVMPLDARLQESIHSKDLYLVECYLAAKADLLITSDTPLFEAIRQLENQPIKVIMRDDFLKEYMHG